MLPRCHEEEEDARSVLPRRRRGALLLPSPFPVVPLQFPLEDTRCSPFRPRSLPLSCVVCFLVLRVNVEHQIKKKKKKEKERKKGSDRFSLALVEQAKLLHLLVFLVDVSSPVHR